MLLESFGDASGLGLNSSTTESLWIGSKTNSGLKLIPEKGFKWPKKKLKLLLSGNQQILTLQSPKTTMTDKKK